MATIIYDQFMSPQWLNKNGDFKNGQKSWKLNELKITGITSNTYQSLWEVPLTLASGTSISSNQEVVIKINVGLEYCREKSTPQQSGDQATQNQITSSLAIVIVDEGQVAVGFNIEPTSNYGSVGPYRGIEGTYEQEVLDVIDDNLKSDPASKNTVKSTRYPQLFEMVIKPQDGWGGCYSAIDNGHLLTVKYEDMIEVDQDLMLVICEKNESSQENTYKINYFEVAIWELD